MKRKSKSKSKSKSSSIEKCNFTQQKKAYRRSKTWHEFRDKVLAEHGDINQLTGLPFSGQKTCHHKRKSKNIEEYMDTDISDFIILQSSQHTILHKLASLKCAPGSPLSAIKEIIKPLIGDEWLV